MKDGSGLLAASFGVRRGIFPPGLGLLLLTTFLPRLCIPLLPHTGGCSFKPAIEKGSPLLGFVPLDAHKQQQQPRFPLFSGGRMAGGAAGQSGRRTDGFFSADGAKRTKLCKPPESTRDTEIK